jgi:hypothetical protein
MFLLRKLPESTIHNKITQTQHKYSSTLFSIKLLFHPFNFCTKQFLFTTGSFTCFTLHSQDEELFWSRQVSICSIFDKFYFKYKDEEKFCPEATVWTVKQRSEFIVAWQYCTMFTNILTT